MWGVGGRGLSVSLYHFLKYTSLYQMHKKFAPYLQKVQSNHYRYSSFEALSSFLLQLLFFFLSIRKYKTKSHIHSQVLFPVFFSAGMSLFLLITLSCSNSINKSTMMDLLCSLCFSASQSAVKMLKSDTQTLFLQKSHKQLLELSQRKLELNDYRKFWNIDVIQ